MPAAAQKTEVAKTAAAILPRVEDMGGTIPGNTRGVNRPVLTECAASKAIPDHPGGVPVAGAKIVNPTRGNESGPNAAPPEERTSAAGQGSNPRRLLPAVILWAALVHAIAFAVVARHPGPFPARGSWSPALEAWEHKAPLARWDSYWYWSIATRGYEWKRDRKMHDVAFFPLTPLLMAAVSRATGLHPFLAGEIVSLASILAAAGLLARLARDEGFSATAALRALLFFPTAFYFVAAYSEALFLLTTVAFFLALGRRRFAVAALAGTLAALTRPSGILLVVPVAIEMLRAPRRDRLRYAAVAAGPAAGLGAFALWQWRRFGTPFAYVITEHSAWGRHMTWPWLTLARALRWKPYRPAEFALIAGFAILSLLLLKRWPAGAAYALASLAFILASGSLVSVARYLVTAFPAFFVIGDALERWPGLDVAYSLAGIASLAYLTAQFVAFGWVA